MSAAREAVLAAIREGLTGGVPRRESEATVPVADRTQAAGLEENVRRFSACAAAAAATLARVPALADVPAAVADYLQAQGLPPRAVVAASAPAAPWSDCSRLSCGDGPLRDDGDTLVTGCLAAVAEVGAVALASGIRDAPEAAFLAATHVVLVHASQVLESLESLWETVQRQHAGNGLPRMLNLVRGPSRTADLGVPVHLGAHGPLRLHVIIIGEPLAVAQDAARDMREMSRDQRP
jgi:L-lactate dehydrogenase complex protein LldG